MTRDLFFLAAYFFLLMAGSIFIAVLVLLARQPWPISMVSFWASGIGLGFYLNYFVRRLRQ